MLPFLCYLIWVLRLTQLTTECYWITSAQALELGDRHCRGLHPTFSTDHSVCLLTKIYWRCSICTAAFFKDHAQVHCCSPSMPLSFFRLLRTIYHKRTNMQTILSCIYHSMLTRLFRKMTQLSQWSNVYRLYDHGWSRINYAWMIITWSSWL